MVGSSSSFKVVGIQNKQALSKVVSYESFRDDLERLIKGAVGDPSSRKGNSSQPILVAFGEMLSLPAAFIGSRYVRN